MIGRSQSTHSCPLAEPTERYKQSFGGNCRDSNCLFNETSSFWEAMRQFSHGMAAGELEGVLTVRKTGSHSAILTRTVDTEGLRVNLSRINGDHGYLLVPRNARVH